jgi:hypothetical protein
LKKMIGYSIHLVKAVWEVVMYLIRMFVFREPVRPKSYFFLIYTTSLCFLIFLC